MEELPAYDINEDRGDVVPDINVDEGFVAFFRVIAHCFHQTRCFVSMSKEASRGLLLGIFTSASRNYLPGLCSLWILYF